MFLEGKQIDRMNDYDSLRPSEKATFTYRMAEKVNKFLDDVAEVNHVLATIPFKSNKKAFKKDHIDLVFNLLEKVLAGLDVAPVTGGNVLDPHDAEKRYVAKWFPVLAVDGKRGRYGSTRPATPEEIALNARLQERITRLTRFVTPPAGLPDEIRPREYFGDLVATAENEGLKPIFEE